MVISKPKPKKEKMTKTWAIGLILICTLVVSLGQFFLKSGANRLVFEPMKLVTNYMLIIGLMVYLVGAVLLVIALRGGEVSVLYPIFATSYIWVTLIAKYALHETITPWRWIGVGTIILGVIFMGFGSD